MKKFAIQLACFAWVLWHWGSQELKNCNCLISCLIPHSPTSSVSLGFQPKMHAAFSSESVQILQNGPVCKKGHSMGQSSFRRVFTNCMQHRCKRLSYSVCSKEVIGEKCIYHCQCTQVTVIGLSICLSVCYPPLGG